MRDADFSGIYTRTSNRTVERGCLKKVPAPCHCKYSSKAEKTVYFKGDGGEDESDVCRSNMPV